MRLTKKTAILLSVLLVLGVAISFIALIMCGFDFATFNIDKYEEKTYEIVDDFKNITINASTADIAFYTAEDGKCKVVCDESEKTVYNVGVQDGRLDIILNDGRKWYDNLRLLDFSDPKIAVYLPKNVYNALKIESDTGDINVNSGFVFEDLIVNASTGDVNVGAIVNGELSIKLSTGNINANGIKANKTAFRVSTGDVLVKDAEIIGDLLVTVSTGKTVLENVTCNNFTSSGSTGDITLNNVIIAERMNIERSTGGVKFVGSDAGEINIKTSTGDVEGSLLTDKFFIVNTSTGNINVPETVSESKCRITTSTGNITIKIG